MIMQEVKSDDKQFVIKLGKRITYANFTVKEKCKRYGIKESSIRKHNRNKKWQQSYLPRLSLTVNNKANVACHREFLFYLY